MPIPKFLGKYGGISVEDSDKLLDALEDKMPRDMYMFYMWLSASQLEGTYAGELESWRWFFWTDDTADYVKSRCILNSVMSNYLIAAP